MKHETCLLSLAEVIECCTISRATIYRLMAQGNFPRSVQPKGCRRVVWRSSDIQAWMSNLQYTEKK
ncbi:helix-turn-helix transcriptional regulator [Aeromonas caviae]|uniref:helix-turn-helix transcriptional regulator n=1 Tax=Aeromonas caviae TaxID=648 RepID=UPI0019202142|nr:AlpA family phage regulatory protein [Aeromonas caviae]MBL0648415.1 AlpA family phage regulatory protein [Aeromonas caviae]